MRKSDNPERKTQWDLIGVEKGDRMINMDSQIPNKVVEKDSIEITKEVPVVLEHESLHQMAVPLVNWYRKNKRELPWRDIQDPYRIWISEIMLQQTRVEAVKPFYARFLKELPTISDLASAEEDKLLKLWEGLGYYNRVRNMQKAAQQIVVEFGGKFPRDYEAIRRLTGIGNYTAGAISSFAFGIPKPAVDGNVLRVISRVTGSYDDIMKASTKTKVEEQLEAVIPKDEACDFNQGLIELGALVCVPNGAPKCGECPLPHLCEACLRGIQDELPVKKKAKERRIEKRTVLVIQDGDSLAIQKRPTKGLLAGLYEFPNLEGHLTEEEVVTYCKKIGLAPLRIQKLEAGKHIFSHVEWHMIGYRIRVDELEKSCTENMLFIHPQEIQKAYPIPAAFETYTKYVNIELGLVSFNNRLH